jgi:hypothetical protein
MTKWRVNIWTAAELALLLAVALCVMPVRANAVDFSPDAELISKAIQKGVDAKSHPETLFKEYEFGDRGVGVNGLVLTKLFQISHRAAMLAAKGEETPASAFKDLLDQNYLMFQLYLPADSEAALATVKISLRQGTKTLETAELLVDPVEKVLCQKETCIYKRDVFAAFWQKDLEPERLAVLAITYGGQTVDFALQLGGYK